LEILKAAGAYLIAPYRPQKSGGSEEDPERTEAIRPKSLEMAVRRLIARAAEDVGGSKNRGR
jgi:hypothetical protein